MTEESMKLRMEAFKKIQKAFSINTPSGLNWWVDKILGMDNRSKLRLYKIRNILENGK